jgi:hypothetical protein
LSAYIDSIVANGTLTSGLHQSQASKSKPRSKPRYIKNLLTGA